MKAAQIQPAGNAPQALASHVSALVDGELQPAEWAQLLNTAAHSDDVHSTWHSYQVIGDVLRGTAPALSARAPNAFLADVRARLKAEDVPVSAASPGRPEMAAPSAQIPQVRGAAANDPAFRWKLVAGLASVAAVMAVSWQVVATAPSPAGAATAPQLALMAPAGSAAQELRTNIQAAPAQPVLVETAQGSVIRDARLEELLAAHRQYGGTSALQMPAGFLRNATYDAPAR